MGVVIIRSGEEKITESCLFVHKYLYGRIMELKVELDAMDPQLPGSILKMYGRPVAKAPGDPNITEQFALMKVTSPQARELEAKSELKETLDRVIHAMTDEEQQFVRLAYKKELPRDSVIRKMELNRRRYYDLRERVLHKTWKEVDQIDEERLHEALVWE